MGFIVDITETKVFMQVTGTMSDTLINMYIDMIESEIEAVVDRPLARATYTESLTYFQSNFDRSNQTYLNAGRGYPRLFVRNYPIASLVLTSGGSPVTQSSFSYNPNNGVISDNSQYSDPTATYVAGYTTATAPDNLKLIVNLGVVSLFNNNGAAQAGRGNVKSKSIKDFSVTYGNEETGYIRSASGTLVKNYIASNMTTLNRYKRINV